MALWIGRVFSRIENQVQLINLTSSSRGDALGTLPQLAQRFMASQPVPHQGQGLGLPSTVANRVETSATTVPIGYQPFLGFGTRGNPPRLQERKICPRFECGGKEGELMCPHKTCKDGKRSIASVCATRGHCTAPGCDCYYGKNPGQ